MISVAVQKSSGIIYVYDEKNRVTTTLSGELYGFTSTTVSVKKNNIIRIYDEKGHQIGVH